MSKHTEGPWEFDERSGRHISISAKTNVAIADVWWIRCSQEEGEANAMLIKASPDLLKALQHMQEDGLFLPYYAIKAIEKATGEQA